MSAENEVSPSDAKLASVEPTTIGAASSDHPEVSKAPEVRVEDNNAAVLAPVRNDDSFLARVYPRSYLHVFMVTIAFGVALVATTVPQGMSYGRFATRSLNCYNAKGYYKKPMGGCSGESGTDTACTSHSTQAKCVAPCAWTPGTIDDPFCAVFSYPYRLVEATVATRFIPWAGYLIHQFGQWYLLRQAQLARDRGEIKWTLQKDLEGKSAEEKRVGYLPNKYAKWMFGLNMGMTLLKFVQAQVFYDGLASDVPEFSALYSVALWILFVMIVEMPRRGLIFGYWKDFDFKICAKHEIGTNFIPFIRKYHGYAISFGTTYNFWYHPMEGSPGFVLGYLYQFCMILQSSFLFHPLHRNKFWTLLLELGVVPHSILIAVFFANGNEGSAFQFGFGFAFTFIITQMHGFDLKIWQKCVFAALYFIILFSTYAGVGRPISNIAEVARMAMVFAFAPLCWAIWCVFQVLFKPFNGLIKKFPKSQGVFWFLIWAAQVIVFIVMGATEGRSPEAQAAS